MISPIKVLVVDDSSFFCQQLTQILNADPDLKVIGIASNGRDAITKSRQLNPDVITMDIEMPVMDGITALKEIMKTNPVPVLMISSLTYEGAKLTLDAMDAGAVDFLLKSYESLSNDSANNTQGLREKVKAVAKTKIFSNSAKLTSRISATKPQTLLDSNKAGLVSTPKVVRPSKNYKILIIGASTGGPVVVQKILTSLPANFPVPVVVVQHMPATFTGAFANRLNGLCELEVEEATDRATLESGKVLIAPGGKQFYFEKKSAFTEIRIRPEDSRVNFQPCVDISFASAAKTFNDGVLALVLTGMGSDGKEGARLLKQKNASVWAQNQETCVVYGMPMAVVNAGLADKILGMDEFGIHLQREFKF